MYDSGNASSLVCTKESCLDVRSFKKIYPNFIVASHEFFDNFLRNCFLFLIQGKLIVLKYAGKQLIYLTRFSAAFDPKYVENTTL